MPPRDIALDSNVFLLFLVGMYDRRAIRRHKRLRAYTPESFDKLCTLVARFDRIIVTPGCLAEVTDLLDFDRPSREGCYALLKTMLQCFRDLVEVYIPAETAVEEASYLWLGIADATYVELAKQGIPVVTADLRLYQQAVAYCAGSCNFPVIDLATS